MPKRLKFALLGVKQEVDILARIDWYNGLPLSAILRKIREAKRSGEYPEV